MKTVSTDSLYQSTFLPLFQIAETKIKKLIVYYFWNLLSKSELRIRIAEIIKDVGKKIPKDLPNKEAYLNGLARKSNLMIQKYYDKALIQFTLVSGLLLRNVATLGVKIPKVDTPKQMVEVIENKRINLKYNMWSEAKGVPQVKNYASEVNKFIERVSQEPITTSETGKKPISLWQKAELDIRHNKQMEMLNDLRDSKVKYAWTSTHPDCSKRCEKWQGKLFNIDESAHSELSGFRMKEKIDGHTVYCLQDVISQKDKYGYNNNIIVGFNCRHKLIEYTPNSLPPKQYTKEDIKKQRAIEENIRSMERTIRQYRTNAKTFKVSSPNKAYQYERMANQLEKVYIEYCTTNGYAWEQYRIDV